MSGTPLPARILIPVANPATAAELIRIGAALADRRTGELTALGVVEVPADRPLSDGATRARQSRRLLQRLLDFGPEGIPIHPIVRIGRHAADAIVETATETEADLIVFGWGGKASTRGGSGTTVSPVIDRVVREAPCDIAVVKQRGTEAIRRILVPIRGGPHAELALRFADGIARRHGATVDVLHLVPPGIPDAVRAQEEHALAAVIRRHLGGSGTPLLREAANVRNEILREAETADLVIMGAAATPGTAAGAGDGREGVLFGALPEAIATRAHASVVVVKTREPIGSATFDRLAEKAETLVAADRAAEEAGAIPARVERWFGESNFHHAEFADLSRLVQLKEKQHLAITLLLPVRDREETIGPIVRRTLRELVRGVPLVDEILVVDTGSTDATREVAAAEGARVVDAAALLDRYGSYPGRGEGLWKGLHEATGDLVAWVATDARGWDPRLVYATLGPLLVEPRIQFVSGYHQRPTAPGHGAGPVTDLVVRPLLDLFFPELSGVIEPLGGEWAGRRSLLETLPFFTGEAVEVGLLVDVSERVGLDGLGQVDLERRGRGWREGDARTLTGFAILQALMTRLEERRRTRLFAEATPTLKLPRASGGRLGLEIVELPDRERPPLIRIPEYLERRRSLGEHRAGGEGGSGR